MHFSFSVEITRGELLLLKELCMSVASDLADAVSGLSTDVSEGLAEMNGSLTAAITRVEAAIASGSTGVPEADVVAATRAVQVAASDMRDGMGMVADKLDAVVPAAPAPEPF